MQREHPDQNDGQGAKAHLPIIRAVPMTIMLSSNPDVILGCTAAALMARVKDSTRFDQQQLDLVFGIRLVFDAFRDDEHFARRYADCAIAKIDPQNTLQHDEGLIRVLVIVPDEVALQFHDLELVIVHFSNNLRSPMLVQQLNFLLKLIASRFMRLSVNRSM
jgi:hypothetical protein